MNTAQRLAAQVKQKKQNRWIEVHNVRKQAQELVMKLEAPNCFDRVYVFADGSRLLIDRDGVKVQ